MQTEDVIMRKQRVLVEKEGNVSLKIENYNLKLLEQKNVNQVKKIAYHEVAHLVVAEKCNGYYIDELYGLTIVPIKQERGTLFGSAMFTMKKSVKNENIIQYIKSGIDYIAISLAGNIAERIGFPNEIAHESILDCEYAKEKAESIIQCDDIAMSGREKASYCRLSTFFMKNLKKEKDTYYFVFRLYYPKEYICNVEVKKINKLYKITSFTLDI